MKMKFKHCAETRYERVLSITLWCGHLNTNNTLEQLYWGSALIVMLQHIKMKGVNGLFRKDKIATCQSLMEIGNSRANDIVCSLPSLCPGIYSLQKLFHDYNIKRNNGATMSKCRSPNKYIRVCSVCMEKIWQTNLAKLWKSMLSRYQKRLAHRMEIIYNSVNFNILLLFIHACSSEKRS